MSSDRKRILYCNSWSSAHGGSSTSLLDIVRGLDRDRYEPLVVCPEAGPLPDRLREASVPVVVHPLSRLTREEVWRFVAEVPWYVKLLKRERIALVHGNTSASRRSLLQATRLCRIPYVQHVRNGAKQPRGQFGYKLAAAIIVNSNDAGKTLYADPEFSRKTTTIYNAVSLSRYDSFDCRRQEIGGAGRPILGFVGQIVPRKGIDILLRALPAILARFPSALLAIVGCAPPDEPQYERECRSLVTELGLAQNVLFTGYRFDVPAWMRTFDVFVLPARSEPFGKVVIEAMAARRPVVASAVGGIPEILTSPELGTLIPPDDPAALSRAVSRYLDDRELASRTGEHAERLVRSRFSLNTMVTRLQEVYDHVLSGGRIVGDGSYDACSRVAASTS